MDPNVQVALISGVITIMVGIITAIASFKGAVKGAKTQIEYEREILKKKEEEQSVFTESAIQQFVMREVRNNFELISSSKFDLKLTEDLPCQYGYNFQLKFEEFNQFKHELIRSKSDIVERILLYYDAFYLLDKRDDLKDFNQNEFEKLKEANNIFIANDYLQ